jgi:putative transposase
VHAAVPAALDVHLVIDNYGTHKHAKVRAWLAKRPRFHVHYTPTYASWRNQIERWFGILSQREIRRGSFTSHNDCARPFSWTRDRRRDPRHSRPYLETY